MPPLTEYGDGHAAACHYPLNVTEDQAAFYIWHASSTRDEFTYAMKAAERSVDRLAQPTRPGTRSLFENTGTQDASPKEDAS